MKTNITKPPRFKRPPSSGKRVENAADAADALFAEATALVGDNTSVDVQRQLDTVDELVGTVTDHFDSLDDCTGAEARQELADQAEGDLDNARAEFEALKALLKEGSP